MRLAVIADIHGNMEALQTVIDDADQKGVHRYVCLGDIVGYGANPRECIAVVRSLPRLNTVLGNHDAAAVWDTSPYGMNKAAQQSIMWTMEQLREQDVAYIKSLPSVIGQGQLLFSHANPYNSKAWRYVNSRKYAMRSFAGAQERLLFVGHTHSPLLIARKNMLFLDFHKPKGNTIVPLHPDKRHIINGGSVGQPRDGDPRAAYCIVDTRKDVIEFYRLEYDLQETGRKIVEAGLPPYHARRLKKGL